MEYNSEERQRTLGRGYEELEKRAETEEELIAGILSLLVGQVAVMADTLEDIKSYLRDQSNQ